MVKCVTVLCHPFLNPDISSEEVQQLEILQNPRHDARRIDIRQLLGGEVRRYDDAFPGAEPSVQHSEEFTLGEIVRQFGSEVVDDQKITCQEVLRIKGGDGFSRSLAVSGAGRNRRSARRSKSSFAE